MESITLDIGKHEEEKVSIDYEKHDLEFKLLKVTTMSGRDINVEKMNSMLFNRILEVMAEVLNG